MLGERFIARKKARDDGAAVLCGFIFQRDRLLRDGGLSAKNAGSPHKPGKARRYTQTVLSGRGGEAERFIPQKNAGWGGGPQRKRREIPPYAARRANNARKKKPGRSVRNDGLGWVVQGTQASRPSSLCESGLKA